MTLVYPAYGGGMLAKLFTTVKSPGLVEGVEQAGA